jgi:uncharacterized membrane protein
MDGSTLIYCGIALMVSAVIIALVSIVVFSVSGKKLRKKLEQDYGKLN